MTLTLAMMAVAPLGWTERSPEISAVSTRPFVVVEDPSAIAIGLDCRGAPANQPVGISLKFRGGKIIKVKTHNADLMKVDR